MWNVLFAPHVLYLSPSYLIIYVSFGLGLYIATSRVITRQFSHALYHFGLSGGWFIGSDVPPKGGWSIYFPPPMSLKSSLKGHEPSSIVWRCVLSLLW